MRFKIVAVWLVATVAILTGCHSKSANQGTTANPLGYGAKAAAGDTGVQTRPAPNPLRDAYFGDLHLHTSYSMDAFAFTTRTTPEDSFKYAMGETVEYMEKPVKRIAPLDFPAVTDHAEYLGVVRETINPCGPFVKTATYTNTIGAVELIGEWTDPDFDPAANATYYARVQEIPTPRWSTYWAAKLNLPPNPAVPAFEQQRAWT